jgi:DNA polymerase III subunit alpha
MWVPLHVKSDYSLGHGTASIEALVDRAVELGFHTLALTDIENLYGPVRFHSYCHIVRALCVRLKTDQSRVSIP